MSRVVVVLVVAGCFSKPGLRDHDRDGGNDDDAAGDGGGDGSMIDSPIAGCSWTPLGTILDDPAFDERHPWISSDGKIVTYWKGTGNGGSSNGLMWQAERPGIGQPFDAPIQIFPQSPATSGAPNEADPSFDHGMLKMYVSTSSGILTASRAMPNGMFQTPTNDNELSLVSSTRQFQEGAFLTDDGRKLLFVAGDSTYDSEDLYIATRSTSSGTFTSVKPFDHNVVGTNECCPTMAGNVVMYERPIAGGKKEIVSSILDGTTLSAPELVVLPGTNSFQQPSLSADGTRLVYVVNLGSDWHLEEAELSCP